MGMAIGGPASRGWMSLPLINGRPAAKEMFVAYLYIQAVLSAATLLRCVSHLFAQRP